jgi:transcriptional regulator with XRE-family HTH domain
MEHRAEVAEFLRTRRDRITPGQAGILSGHRRRVPGLRREEVALLAGVSVEYYARMERGDLSGVSPEVLDSLSQALQLDEAETGHFHDLAKVAGPRPARPRNRPADQTVRPSLQRLLDAITGAPVWIRDRRMVIITANALGRALYAPIIDDPVNQANTARFISFNPGADTFFPDWDRVADESVATLRSYAGRRPHDKGLTDLIGELVTRSDDFRMR